MVRNIWVLGATGYVGNALTNHLIQHTDKDTVITTLAHKKLPFKDLESTNLIVGSLEDFDTAWFERFPPDVVFHCARIAGKNDRARMKAAARGERANQHLREALKNTTVIYCSGTLMYGNQTGTANEDTALNPIAYAKHYAQAERPWLNSKSEHEDIRIARPAWILGFDSWFYHFFYKPGKENGAVPYYGTGEQRMSLIHVDDCGKMLHHIYTHGKKNDDYNLFAAPPITQREFAEITAEKMGVGISQIQEHSLIKQTGKTISDALTSDIPVTSKHKDWLKSFSPTYASPSAMLDAVLSKT